MDGSADPDVRLDAVMETETSPSVPADNGARAGEGAPSLMLDGFSGPLDQLLSLARAQKVDLARLSLIELLDQLAAALRQAPGEIPLGQKGDWVVMVAWLLQLRSRLLLPADAAAQRDATAEAGSFLARLVALEDAQALAVWLERRPQLGHNGFARGRPEVFGVSVEAGPAIDVIEFLWASLALFDDTPEPAIAPLYQPRRFALYPITMARERILRRLAETPDGGPLGTFVPDVTDAAATTSEPGLWRRSAWSSSFVASLELAKEGELQLAQGGDFHVIHLSQAAVG